jgi:hypothetical protein
MLIHVYCCSLSNLNYTHMHAYIYIYICIYMYLHTHSEYACNISYMAEKQYICYVFLFAVSLSWLIFIAVVSEPSGLSIWCSFVINLTLPAYVLYHLKATAWNEYHNLLTTSDYCISLFSLFGTKQFGSLYSIRRLVSKNLGPFLVSCKQT